MQLSFTDLQKALIDQGVVVQDIVAEIADLSSPTRLPGWSCSVLVGHMTAGLEALWRWSGEDTAGRVELDAVSYWDPAAAVAEPSSNWAIEYAAKRTATALRQGLEGAITRARTCVVETSPAAPIVPPLGPAWLRFDEFVATRVVELTVHSLDLAEANETPRLPAVTATQTTAAILDHRLAAPRPPDLTDDIAWIEAASGRSAHADHRLPVLS